MMGKKPLEAAEWLVKELDLEGKLDPAEFLKEREALLEEKFRESPLLPGAERLLRHLTKHGIPCALATGSRRDQYDLKTTRHRELFASSFKPVITGDMVARGKPDPEIFKLAASGFEGGAPPAGATLVFEDAPNGVEAALAADMRVVMVPDSQLARGFRGEAHMELPSLESFDPAAWGLPQWD